MPTSLIQNLDTQNFKKAELQLADLTEASFEKANLQDASLQGATLTKANFTGANLKQARFQQAKFQGANLSSADFSDANIIGAEYDDKMKCRGINVSGCFGSPRFVRHVIDLDYIEETKDRYPKKYWFWKLTSNCGRSILPWTAWSAALALIFGVIFAHYPVWLWLPDWLQSALTSMAPQMDYNDKMIPNGFTPYYFSIVTFTTLGFGDITPLNLAGQIWLTIEVVLGYIMLGGLITLFATKMVRQSG